VCWAVWGTEEVGKLSTTDLEEGRKPCTVRPGLVREVRMSNPSEMRPHCYAPTYLYDRVEGTGKPV